MNIDKSCTSSPPNKAWVAVRLLLNYAFTTAALFAVFRIFPRLGAISGYAAIAWIIITAAGLSVGAWPLLVRFLLGFLRGIPPVAILISFSITSLLVPAAIILAASYFTPGLTVNGFSAALAISAFMAFFSLLFGSLVSPGDESLIFQWLLKKTGTKLKSSPASRDKPGLIFFQIDGLGSKALKRAMEAGKAPNLRRWLACGSHKMVTWHSDLSSQTSAAQAGILHGNNFGIPGFRWFDKEQQKVIISASVSDVARLEASISNGNGLLSRGGAVRASIFSGDASRVLLTASRAFNPSTNDPGGYYAYFLNPTSGVRSLLAMIWDWVLEKRAAWGQRLRNERPRIDRGGTYFLQRSLVAVLVRDIALAALRGDIYAGVPYVYCTLSGYDDVAHRSGIGRPDTLEILRKIDREIGRLEKTLPDGARRYRLVALSDHGNSPGATFHDRYGESLVEMVRRLVSAQAYVVPEYGASREESYYFSTVLRDYGLKNPKILRLLEKQYAREEYDVGTRKTSDIVVLASGNAGYVSFRYPARRLTLEEIETLAPGLADGLLAHPGVGFVVARLGNGNTVVLGKKGRLMLPSGEVEGEDPTAEYGPLTRRNMARLNSFPNMPDILVMSRYWPETGEVAAFEEFVGSHGGAGGEQSNPFIIYPSDLSLEAEEIVGAEAVYRLFKHWTEAVEQA